MSTKDIVIIFILIVILVIVIKTMKTTKLHTEVMTAIGVKTGALEAQIDKSKKASKKKINDDDYDDEDSEQVAPKKPKLKQIQKDVISLFSDGIPKTSTELKKLYLGKFKSKVEDTKFHNTLWNLIAPGILNKEKIEKANYWGLQEWFDEENLLLGDYADKIENGTSLTVISNS